MRGPPHRDQTRPLPGAVCPADRDGGTAAPAAALGGSPGSPARKPSGAAGVSGFRRWIFHFCFEAGECFLVFFLRDVAKTQSSVMAVS